VQTDFDHIVRPNLIPRLQCLVRVRIGSNFCLLASSLASKHLQVFIIYKVLLCSFSGRDHSPTLTNVTQGHTRLCHDWMARQARLNVLQDVEAQLCTNFGICLLLYYFFKPSFCSPFPNLSLLLSD
jgi:hypothetical protein